MQGLLRFGQLLTMALWVGGLAFFAFVLAPVAFHVLPNTHDAGLVVGGALRVFDWVSVACGGVFLLCTASLFVRAPFRIRGRYEIEFLLAAVMVLGTAYVQWNILPRMESDRRLAGGDITLAAKEVPARIDFERLHKFSEQVEGAVLMLGLLVLVLMSREHHSGEVAESVEVTE